MPPRTGMARSGDLNRVRVVDQAGWKGLYSNWVERYPRGPMSAAPKITYASLSVPADFFSKSRRRSEMAYSLLSERRLSAVRLTKLIRPYLAKAVRLLRRS